MEAWGLIVTVFIMFGMLVPTIASVTMVDRTSSAASLQPPTEAASGTSD